MAFAFAGVFTSCLDDKAEYEPGAPSDGPYFPNTNEAEIKVEGDASQFAIPMMRTDATQEATYSLNVTYPEGADYTEVFNVPSSVTFAAGSKSADVIVTFANADIEYNKDYKMTVSLAGDAMIYGNDSYSFNVMKPLTWTTLGDALYTDDFVTTFFGVDNVSYKVPIQKCDQVEGKYRLVYPYGARYPYNEPGDYDTSANHYMELDCTAGDDHVFIPMSESGMDWGYGEFLMVSLTEVFTNTPEELYEAGYYGTLKDGVITFETGTLGVGMADYNDGGIYRANTNGAFRVVFPGYYTDKDYASAVKYNGLFLDAEDDSYYAVATISVGSDASLAQAAIVMTNTPDEVYDAIINQTVDLKAIAPGKNQTVYFPIKGAGTYTIGLVTYDGDEVVEKNDVTFEVVLGAQEEEGNWEDLGEAVFVDGWLLPGFTDNNEEPINPFDWAYYVNVQKDLDNPGVYRIASPYIGDVPLGNFNDNKKMTYLVFDCSDPDFVVFQNQYSGMSMSLFTNGSDPVFVGDGPTMYLEEYSKEDIIAAGVNSTFSDGIIELVEPYFGPSVDEVSYYWQNVDHYPVIVELPDASAKAKFNAMWNRGSKKVFGKSLRTKRIDNMPMIVKRSAKRVK